MADYPDTADVAAVLWLRSVLRSSVEGTTFMPPDGDGPLRHFEAALAVGSAGPGMFALGESTPQVLSARESLEIYESGFGSEPDSRAVRLALDLGYWLGLPGQGCPDPDGVAAMLARLWGCELERPRRLEARRLEAAAAARSCPVCGGRRPSSGARLCGPCTSVFEWQTTVAAGEARLPGGRTRAEAVAGWSSRPAGAA